MELPHSTVTLTGPEVLGHSRLYSMSGQEGLSELFAYRIEFLREEEDLDLPALLGQTVTVHLPLEMGRQRHFSGLVTNASRLGWRGRYASFTATLAPDLWLLTRASDCRIFQDVTVPDLVKDILRTYGIQFREAIFAKYRQWDYITQYRESDFEFVSRILAHEGIYFFFEHTEAGHKVVLADSESSHEPIKGFEKVPLIRPLEKHEFPDYLTDWTATHAIQTNAVALGDFEFRLRGKAAVLEARRKAAPEHARGQLATYEYPGRTTLIEDKPEADASKSQEEGERLTAVRLEEQRCKSNTFRGEGTARGLAAGGLFAIANAHSNQKFLITSTSITLRNALFESGADQVDEPCQLHLTAIDCKVPFRPRRPPKLVMHGPQTARVVGGADEEIWTDKYGRIKVQLHWDREGASDENSSCWLRVAQPWAGNHWGAIHIPRVGNEVIVEFLDGDPDRPVVTGSLYNADNMPPYALPDHKTQTGIKTRSTKGGSEQNFNEIRFEDKKGHEELHVQAERDQTTVVKRNQSLAVHGDRSVTVVGNQTVTISGKGQSPIQSAVTVTGKHTFDATDTIEIQAPTSITLRCGGSTLVMEPNKVTIAAGGGARIELNDKALTQAEQGGKTIHDANVLHQADGGGTLFLDANVLAQSNDGSTIQLDANVIAQSSGGSSVQLDGDAALVGAGAATVQGETEGTLTAGAGSVKTSAAGIEATGPKIDVSGTTVVNVTGPTVKLN